MIKKVDHIGIAVHSIEAIPPVLYRNFKNQIITD